MAQAFISYQTADKKVAGAVKEILKAEGIESFLAHEDIPVSEEWRLEILKKIRKAQIFVALISKNYHKSVWCIQEAGIAAGRTKMASICLLLDETTPPGFLQAVQGKQCKDGVVELSDLLPGLVKAMPDHVLGKMIDEIAKSGSYRWAEESYAKLVPYADKLSREQAKRLLEAGYENGQVRHAHLCVKEYIPKVMRLHEKTISAELRQKIAAVSNEHKR